VQIQPRRETPQSRPLIDVSQAFTPCQLCERKTAKLVETGEVLDLMITTVARDTTPKHLPRQMIQDLRENVLAFLPPEFFLHCSGKNADQNFLRL
jgi:hypothetical protein